MYIKQNIHFMTLIFTMEFNIVQEYFNENENENENEKIRGNSVIHHEKLNGVDVTEMED
jgi:hypothetical protein